MIQIDGQFFKLRTKKEIFSESFQLILKNAYISKSKNRCVLCNVDMYIAKLGSKFFLKSFPNKASKHKEFCIFHKEGIESFISEDSKEIVLKSEGILFKTSTSKNKLNLKTGIQTERKIKNFNHLIFLLLDEIYAKAFNIKNNGIDRLSGEIRNVDVSTVITFLKRNLENLKINDKPIKEILKEKNAFIYTGVIYSANKRTDGNYRYYNGNKSFLIPEDIWERATNIAKIYTNVVSPPYLYLILKSKRKIYRFFILPIARPDFFIPVESSIERKVIDKVINKGYAVFKPMTSIYIKNILTKPIAKDYLRFVSYDIRPDLFIFKRDKIGIIEIVDKNNLKKENYIKRLKFKEKCYSNLASYFEYFRIEI